MTELVGTTKRPIYLILLQDEYTYIAMQMDDDGLAIDIYIERTDGWKKYVSIPITTINSAINNYKG